MKKLLPLCTLFLTMVGYGQKRELDVRAIVKEAKAGDKIAQYNLGIFYLLGAENLPKSYTEAVRWWEKSALQGMDLAQMRLGWAYENGIGVSLSYSKAVEWYQKAAEQGEKEAQEYLGYCYMYGRGVTKDYTQAFHLFEKAAQDDEFGKGRAGAQFGLGACYGKGEGGVPKDNKKATYWLKKACLGGVEQACKILSMK